MTDAHCHPHDLLRYTQDIEGKLRETDTACAANSWNLQQFEYHKALAKKAHKEHAVFCCFALHPQLSPSFAEDGDSRGELSISLTSGLDLLHSLASTGQIDAVGETGFDLYDERFKATEKLQEHIFTCHVETALTYNLPLVLHVRRAMHKVFPFVPTLKKLPAIVFHSWSGTKGEGESLLRRGVNAFFSFGTTVLNKHRQAMLCASSFPADRILLETDAPYQPLHGKAFSSWDDLPAICAGITALRKEAGSPCNELHDLEAQTTANFLKVFSRW